MQHTAVSRNENKEKRVIVNAEWPQSRTKNPTLLLKKESVEREVEKMEEPKHQQK